MKAVELFKCRDCAIWNSLDPLIVVTYPACKQTQASSKKMMVFFFMTLPEPPLTGHLLIPINHELSCIVSPASPPLPPLPSPLPPPFTFSLSVNKLWHHDSDVCATEWCLAAALIGKVLKCSGMKGVSDEIVFLSSLWQNVKMAAWLFN